MRKLGALVVVAVGLHETAAAQTSAAVASFPTRPIRMVAGWPAGGGSDVVARLICNQLSTSLGQQVLVDNRAGAGNSIASEIVAKAPANGYTFQFVNANHTLNPFVYEKLSYDTERDFAPVSQVTRSALVLVSNASLPVASVKELVTLAHAKPNTLAAATAGSSGSGAVTTEVFKRLSGIPFIVVPYKGGGPAMLGVVQGESQFAIASQASAMPFIKSAKVKVLAAASKTRLAHMPDVPTFQDAGLPAIDLGPWEGIIAPAKTPPAIIELMHRHASRALKQPEVVSTLSSNGIEVVGSTPAEFGEHIRQQLALFRRVFGGGIGKPAAAHAPATPSR